MRTSDTIQLLASRLVNGVHAEQAWLFGSHARGTPHSDSDIDILLIVPDSKEPRYKRMQAARKLVIDIPVPKDIIVMTRAEWEMETACPSSLASAVLREGRLLYG